MNFVISLVETMLKWLILALMSHVCRPLNVTASLHYCVRTLLSQYSLEFWHPISLLHLRKVLPSIIDIDQTCSIPGRSILDNVHLLRNIADFCNERNIECAFLSLDQSKAFDRVDHHFLFPVLEAFGFGPSFIKWFRIIIFRYILFGSC